MYGDRTYQKSNEAGSQIDEGLRAHMNKVYGLMSAGTAISFAFAWAFGNIEGLTQLIYNVTDEGKSFTILGWIALFAPLAMIFGFMGMIRGASAAATQMFYYAFTALMGVSLSSIFLTYTDSSIAQVFLLSSAAFAGLSLWGYTTKKDISGWGSFLIMGLIGLIGASILNLFIGSSALDFALSVVGVLIFAGLTAYDTQKIKTDYISHARNMDEDWLQKSAIMGALDLYLDFLNLFLQLLLIFGKRD